MKANNLYVDCPEELVQGLPAAKLEARRRWGKRAKASISNFPYRCVVSDGYSARGVGFDWSSAFSEADKRTARIIPKARVWA